MPAPTHPAILRQDMDALAEHVANGGSLVGWARANGRHPTQVGRLWKRICNALGRQAI